jgi:hypothetical protein
MPAHIAYYYARFFLGCMRFPRNHYHVFPDYATMPIPTARAQKLPVSACIFGSSPFILNYLTRRGFVASAFLRGAAAAQLPAGPALQQLYGSLAKPFRHVVVPLSAGVGANEPVFLSTYPVSPASIYSQLFPALLRCRLPLLLPCVGYRPVKGISRLDSLNFSIIF